MTDRPALNEAAASSGAVRDGSGRSVASLSASSNPNSGGSAPLPAAAMPSWDGDALPDEAGIIRIYCRGELLLASYLGDGYAVCPGCGAKLKVVH